MPKPRLSPWIASCGIAVCAIAFSAPSGAESRPWQADVVASLAVQLDELVHGIRGRIERADAMADALSSRRTAAARATLGDLEKATLQLARSLKAGATRDATQPIYQRIRTLRADLSSQATEVGFSDPAIELIVRARDVLEELDAYYGSG